MKRFLLLFLTVLFIGNFAKSQSNTWVAPGNYMAATISDASFINANSGWVVGSGGIIYATTNGGTSWSAQSSGTTNALSAVHFVNATHGWAVGALGTIVATVNGGTTWTSQSSGLSVTLTGVHFVSNTIGWAIGSSGNILATTDGGSTWTPQVSGVSIALSSIYFVNANQGWVSGAGGNILSTSNGGATWTAQVTGTVNALSGIYFINATQGWAVGAAGTILTTANGGANWTRQTSGSVSALSALHFINGTQGWAVGATGTMLTTINGGTSWSTIASGTTNALSFVYFSNANKGFIGGINIVLSTINGGTAWSSSLSGTTSTLRSVYFLNSTMCWAAGSGPTIIATTNGGATWIKQTIPTKSQVYGICFANANQGWAVDLIGEIINTNNGGTTWTQQTSPTTNALTSVYFISASQGWAVGAGGTIVTTSNGGTTWTQQTSPTANNLTDVNFVSATQGWAVGASGTILTTNNGGATWVQQTSPVTNQLNSISMYNATQGWAVGNNGIILTTNNGGNSWAIQTSSTNNQLTNVHFVSAKQGWAVGITGTILTTNDGGITWVVQSTGTTQPLYGVSFNNATLQGCAVGNAGTILLYNPNDTAIKAPVIGSFSPTSVTSGSTVTIKGTFFTGTTDVSFGGTSSSSFTVLNDSTITAVIANGSSGDVVVKNTIGSNSLAGFIYGGAAKTYTWTRPSNYINCTLTNANFVNVTQAWAVGSNGTILATNDGGTTWVSQVSGKTTTLNSTYFYSALQGCAVGVSGVILTTTDGGKTWVSRNSGIGISLTSTFFISPSQGWVAGAGGNILVTADSGATWTAQASGTTNNLTKIYFINATIGWALGANGTILSTTDGGSTWNTQVSNTINNLTGICFVNANVGWVVGSGYLLTTTNGGQTWNTRSLGYSLSTIYMASATKGWGLGNSGSIITTANGGTTWKVQITGTNYNLTGIYFTDSTQGHVVGFTGSNITTMSTVDGGTNWASQVLIGNTAQLNSVNFSDSANGWTVSSTGSILNSSNGGNTWQNQTSPSSTILGSVYFASPTQGWAVGSGTISSNVIATSNGGITWTGQTSPVTNQLYGVYFINTLQGWAVGASGTILNTINGGATWVKQTSPVLTQLTGVYFITTTRGWIVGTGGVILTTADGGTNWIKQTSPTTNQLLGINFINANQGWAVGGLNGVSGTILTTSNGGTTWTAQTSGTINLLNSVHFISATQGWVVGNSGTILTTTNGGVTWVPQASGTTNNLLGVNFKASTQQGWAVGASGQILLYNASNVSVAPKITSFSPAIAATGTSVIIKGTSFKGTTSVSFGGTNAKSFIVINDSTINAIVGNGASGLVSVTNAGGTYNLTGFHYLYYVNVSFNVDITNYLKAGNTVGTNGIRIAGAFASLGAKSLPDWLPTAAACAMTKGASNVWSIKVSMPDTSIGKSLLYKFVNNDWGQNEGIDVSNSLLSCGQSDGFGNVNRLFLLPSADTTVSYCWDQCSSCNISSSLPSITTFTPTDITVNSATLSGNLTAAGGDIVKMDGIVYGTSPNPTTLNSQYHFWTNPSIGVFSYSQAGLLPNTTYYVRAFAANSIGTTYGNQLVFNTLKPCPNIVSNTVNLSGCTSVIYKGITYTVSTSILDTTRTLQGCDSIYSTVNINILQPTSSSTSISICEGATYSFNGTTYNKAGVYITHLKNSVGCDSAATLVLTIKPISTSITNATICAGATYTFNGSTYTTAGSYVVHLINSVGCDSSATLNLSISSSSVSTTNVSLCQGGSYTFNGTTYTTAGSYTAHLTNSVGCDSIATLNLSTKSPSTSTTNISICQGGSYTFNGITYSLAGTYLAHLTNSVGCDSAATLNLSIKSTSSSTTNMSICSGSSYTFNGTTYATAGAYIAHLINSVGCDSAATLNLSIHSTSSSTTNISICLGGGYSFNGTTYTTAGTYIAHLTNSVGCDSVATLNLTIKSLSTSSTNMSICQGSSYTFNGTDYKTSGIYIAHLTNSVGCDSAATLNLTIKSSSTSSTNISICQGNSYTFNGTEYKTAGIYVAHLTNSVGCDSTVTLNLSVKSASTSISNVSICQGESYTFNGTDYNVSGTYIAHLTNSLGCDSAATLVLTVKAKSSSITYITICSQSSYTFNGITYTKSGSYTVHLLNSVGCDSAATLILTVTSTNSTTYASICKGNNYYFNGSIYSVEGTYTTHLMNSVGCDSTAILVLSVSQPSTSTTVVNTCSGKSYFFNGVYYSSTGTYITHLANSAGCDSAATLILTVNKPTSSITTASICSGSSYFFNGTTYSKTGNYTIHLLNAGGCDSLATLSLTVLASSSSTTNISICEGDSYTFNGTTYTISGSYTEHLPNAVGCDSAATLILTVNPLTNSTTNASICLGSSYTFNGTTYSKAGSYTVHLNNAAGCDSAATLLLTINAPSVSNTNASICAGNSYTFNGTTYTKGGSYIVHLINALGCDSVATLNLTVKQTTSSNTNASICSGSSYTFNGSTYTQAGSYSAHLTNSVGCDSTATLVLTLKSTSISTTNASICAGGSYTFNGSTYFQAGSYIAHLTNALGCDSAASLILTVKPNSSSITNASICSSSTYSFNGTSYNKAGTYIVHLINSVGCDSAATLVLTVNNLSTSVTKANICTGGSYTFNGSTYSQSGSYIAHLTNAIGCDSAATLVLTVNLSTSSTTKASICAGGSFTFNGTTYTQAGSYIAHLTNAVDCDSTATLVLTIISTSASTTNASICAGSSYFFNGTTYSQEGSYSAHLINSVGCDSVATLVLTVKSASVSSVNASICSGDSYSFNGNIYNAAGTYTVHLTNSVGCDSAASLVLTIKETSGSVTNASVNLGENYIFNGNTYSLEGTYTVHLSNTVGCDSVATLILTVNSNYTISGGIKNALGTIIPSVSVGLNGNQTITTDANGMFSFTAVANSNNSILPSKNDDKIIANGVNGTDISLIQSHILKKVILNSPYKLIAADVNSDGSVNGTDIALIKSLILKRITKFAGNKLWSFVDSSYIFPVPTKPFPFNESINIASISSNQSGKNFIGLKLGDVNYDWNSSILGAGISNSSIELFNDNISFNSATSEVRVPIKVKNFRNIMGMQYTLNFNSDALELKSVENNNLSADYNMGFASEGKLPLLWVDAASEARTLPDNTVLFELVFKKKGSFLHEDISLSSDITAINAFDGNYNTVGIKKEGGVITESGLITTNITVYPNPAKDNITIKSAHISAIQVIDIFGKVVKTSSLKDATNPMIQVGGLASGVYRIRVQNTEGRESMLNFIKD